MPVYIDTCFYIEAYDRWLTRLTQLLVQIVYDMTHGSGIIEEIYYVGAS